MCKKNDILPELNGKQYIYDLENNYNIMFCPINYVDKLMDFIDLHWRKGHVFSISKELLDWQHLNLKDNRYNFVIAVERNTDEIHSILGFVPTSQFDSEISVSHVWPCIWKSRNDVVVKGLGVALYYYLKENISIDEFSILGISEIALSIYKKWGFSYGKLRHYYILNTAMSSYNLVSQYEDVVGVSRMKSDIQYNISECTLNDFEILDFAKIAIPTHKSKKYYINRFFKHPVYKYCAYSVNKGQKTVAIIFMRSVANENSNALRIVDCCGQIDCISFCKDALQNLIVQGNFEYIDFMNSGIDASIMLNAGFVDKNSSDIIIPNYYEPFVLQNIELDYAFKSVRNSNEAITFFKADADQDRPNLL